MRKTIKKILFYISVLSVAAVVLYAGFLIYRHEHEVNSRIADIGNSVSAIESALTEKPIRLIEKDQEQFLSSVDSLIAGAYDLDVYQKIANGQDISILFIGDSITRYSWVEGTADWISENYNIGVSYSKLSFPGNSSYAGYVSVKRIPSDERYDLAIICYGQNDSPNHFATEYEALVRAVIEHNPKCRIVSVLEASQQEYTEKMKEIKNIAQHYNIAVADSIKTHKDSGRLFTGLFFDGVHPTEDGSALYLKAITDAIQPQIESALKGKEDLIKCLINGLDSTVSGYSSIIHPFFPEPLAEDVSEYDSFFFIPYGDFKRISDKVYEIQLKGISGLIGIDRIIVPGSNSVKIFCNEELIYNNSWEVGRTFELEQIYPLEKGTLNGSVKVEIETPDRFLGLIVSCDTSVEELPLSN